MAPYFFPYVETGNLEIFPDSYRANIIVNRVARGFVEQIPRGANFLPQRSVSKVSFFTCRRKLSGSTWSRNGLEVWDWKR